jgi:hypothetical protein
MTVSHPPNSSAARKLAGRRQCPLDASCSAYRFLSAPRLPPWSPPAALRWRNHRLNHRLPGVSQITRITQATSSRCPTVFGVHIGTSPKKNHAPDTESHRTHQTQELSGSAFSIGRRTEPKFRGIRRFASAKKLSFVLCQGKIFGNI